MKRFKLKNITSYENQVFTNFTYKLFKYWKTGAQLSGDEDKKALLEKMSLSIDSLMKGYDNYGRFSGSVFVANADNIWYSEGFGYRDYERHIKNDDLRFIYTDREKPRMHEWKI